MAWLAPVEGMSSTCRRIAVAPGVEVLIDEQHPALRLNGDASVIAEAFRQALSAVVGLEQSDATDEGSGPVWSDIPHEPIMVDEARLSPETP
jgi:hypothetical protein